MTWNPSSSANSCALVCTKRVVHHLDACDSSTRVCARVFLLLFFIFFLDVLVFLFPPKISIIFIRKLLALVLGDHGASKLKTDPGRNSSKQNTSRKRYTDLQGSGGLYSKNFHDKRKAPDRTRVGKGRRGGQTIGRRGPRSGRAALWWHPLVRPFHSVSNS